MNRKSIPQTDLRVSPLCLGTMNFGIPVPRDYAVKMVHWAIDHGINFIDTANMYEGYNRTPGSSGGVAEEILGEALQGRREQVVMATKVGMPVGEATEDEGTSPAAIDCQLDRSLKRLRTGYVDIYYLHKPDPETPIIDMVAALDRQIKAGKIRHYGVSNYSATELLSLLAVADSAGLPRPVIHQPSYSLLKRDIEEDLLPLCRDEQIAVAPYQILQGGLLTGKYKRGQNIPVDSRKAEKDSWVWELNNQLFDRLETIEAEARSKGRSLMEHSILEPLACSPIISLVLGFKRIEQLEQVLAVIRSYSS